MRINLLNLIPGSACGSAGMSTFDMDKIHVDETGTVATNGHIIMRVSPPEEGEELLDVSPSKGKFPKYESVLASDPDPVIDIDFDASYLLAIFRATSDFTADLSQARVNIKLYGPEKNMIVTAFNEITKQTLVASAMPLRKERKQ